MKISREWLLEYVDFNDLPFEEVTELITTRVAEIEEVYQVGEPCSKAIFVRVEKVIPHPSKENLRIVEVSDGKKIFQVVCGAKNLEKGMITVYIPVGARVREPNLLGEEEKLKVIELRDIQGVKSDGILVSESELGIGTSHDGIMDVTDQEVEIGASIASVGLVPDTIFDIDNKSLTHRPDLWCHFGFARELSAILKRPLKRDYDEVVEVNKLTHLSEISDLKISIDQSEYCKRLSFLSIGKLKNGPTPMWLRKRLFSIGAGSRNVLIDLSNYILHDVGQPNHAYDAKKLRGRDLSVRLARNEEAFTGLDSEVRKLSDMNLVVSDSVGPVALAGVIGGNDFSLDLDSETIILEAANFDPVSVRKTCKEHNLRTDSSVRFEKSLSPVQTVLAPLRFMELMDQLNLEYEILGYSDLYPKKPEDIFVDYRETYIQERLGGVPEIEEVDEILTRLKFERNGTQLKVPYFRATRDISIEDDLVEEVGRTIGYERVPSVAPKIDSSASKRSALSSTEIKVREVLSGEGFTEVYCYTFASKERTQSLGYSLDQSIEVLNSVDKNLNIVQLTLVPNMLDVLNLNIKNADSFFGFEIGRAYSLSEAAENGYVETRLCSISGIDSSKNDSLKLGAIDIQEGALFYSIRKSVERLVYSLCGKEATFTNFESIDMNQVNFNLKTWMHPYRAANILIDSNVVGVLSEVKPSLIDVKGNRAIIAELDIEAITKLKDSEKHFSGFSRFPKSHFEVSLVVDSKLEYSRVENVFTEAFKNEVYDTQIIPFSIYRGAPLLPNQKSLSLRFTFGLIDGTLSSQQIEDFQNLVLSTAEKNGYSLRG